MPCSEVTEVPVFYLEMKIEGPIGTTPPQSHNHGKSRSAVSIRTDTSKIRRRAFDNPSRSMKLNTMLILQQRIELGDQLVKPLSVHGCNVDITEVSLSR